MKKTKVIAICGKSGAGKDTLLRSFLEWTQKQKQYIPYNKVTIASTRPRREGEAQYHPYHFLTAEEYFTSDISYSSCFNGWYYGVEPLSKDMVNIGIFNPTVLAAMEEDPNLCLIHCYIDTDDKTRLTRSLMREANPDCQEICRRYLADTIDDGEYFDTLRQNALIEVDGNHYITDDVCYTIHTVAKAGFEAFEAMANS